MILTSELNQKQKREAAKLVRIIYYLLLDESVEASQAHISQRFGIQPSPPFGELHNDGTSCLRFEITLGIPLKSSWDNAWRLASGEGDNDE